MEGKAAVLFSSPNEKEAYLGNAKLTVNHIVVQLTLTWK